MCGRYVSVSSPTLLAERLHVDEVRADETEPNYNVTPRTEVPIVAETKDHLRVLDRVRWGLVPSWAKDLSMGDRLINARSEGIETKPAYRRAFEKRRCLIPADGFYEWRALPGPTKRKQKQPYFIARRPRADGVRGSVRGLARSFRSRRVDPVVRDRHDRREREARADPRPHAGRVARGAWGEWLDVDNHDTASSRDCSCPRRATSSSAIRCRSSSTSPTTTDPSCSTRWTNPRPRSISTHE